MNELSHALSPARPDLQEKEGLLIPRLMPDHDIPAFQFIEGEPGSPVVLSVPHGGWLYPESLVGDDNLSQCASLSDTGTAELGLMLAGGRYPALIACCCRAVCDLNRPPAALDPHLCEGADLPLPAAYKPYVAAGYGVIPRLSAQKQPLYSQKLGPAHWQGLLAAWHSPYHRRLSDLLRRATEQQDDILLVDLHSMPDSPKQAGKSRLLPLRSGQLPDFVFGNLHGATLSQTHVRLIDEVMRQSGYSWRWNTPYAGGYITRHYGLETDEAEGQTPAQVLQIEVNRGLYSNPAGKVDPDCLAPVSQLLSQLLAALADKQDQRDQRLGA